MKQRAILITLVVVGLLGATQLFARGANETTQGSLPWDTVKLTGTVSFKELPYPELTSGGKVYELVVPRMYSANLAVKSGDTISIEGVLIQNNAPAGSPAAGKILVRVTKATIGGKSDRSHVVL